ncbi:MAG: cbb3-type cytochrome c oxidase N-terminal domain-containing protein [Kiritimatiellia bacterium]
MSEPTRNNVPDMGHDADGIRELDNFLPRWWLWLLYITVIFGVIYLLVYHVFDAAPLQAEQWKQEVAAAKAQAEKLAASQGPAAAVVEPSNDPEVLALGKSIFDTKANCWTCHGKFGEGLIGPNMCDNYKIHGFAFTDTIHTITEGVPIKGMISWKTQLNPKEIYAVGSYIWRFRDNPPNQKAPEGFDESGKPAPGLPRTPAAPGMPPVPATNPAAPGGPPPPPVESHRGLRDPAVLAAGEEMFETKLICWTLPRQGRRRHAGARTQPDRQLQDQRTCLFRHRPGSSPTGPRRRSRSRGKTRLKPERSSPWPPRLEPQGARPRDAQAARRLRRGRQARARLDPGPGPRRSGGNRSAGSRRPRRGSAAPAPAPAPAPAAPLRPVTPQPRPLDP